jgi:methanogenic corrinoid protein MtbC1
MTDVGRDVTEGVQQIDSLRDAPARERSRNQPDYRRYWLALYRRDVAAAERIIDHALKHWKPERIYLRIFEPALGLSGRTWAAGAITYHDEHFVTYHTARLMRRVRRRWVPRETFGPLALVTGAGQESHLLGLRMVCDFLQASNWRIHWLTSNYRGVARRAAAALKPDAFLLSIGLDEALVPAGRLIQEVREAGHTGLVVVGGAAINRDPPRVQALAADLTASNGLHLVRLLRPRFHQRPWG